MPFKKINNKEQLGTTNNGTSTLPQVFSCKIYAGECLGRTKYLKNCWVESKKTLILNLRTYPKLTQGVTGVLPHNNRLWYKCDSELSTQRVFMSVNMQEAGKNKIWVFLAGVEPMTFWLLVTINSKLNVPVSLTEKFQCMFISLRVCHLLPCHCQFVSPMYHWLKNILINNKTVVVVETTLAQKS